MTAVAGTESESAAPGSAAEPALIAGVDTPSGAVVGTGPGEPTLFVPRERYHEAVATLRASGFELLADLCGVDYLLHDGRTLPAEIASERFEIVAQLVSLARRQRVQVRVQVPADDPAVDSLWDLYPGAEAMEREVYDMFGVSFLGHPDLTRILMPEEWEGHPLRKDYGVGRIPVQFKEAPGPR